MKVIKDKSTGKYKIEDIRGDELGSMVKLIEQGFSKTIVDADVKIFFREKVKAKLPKEVLC